MTGIRRCGFIGLGKIGYAMARNILKSGIAAEICHFDIDESASERFALEGSHEKSTAVEVANSSDILFSILPNDDTLSAVVFGEGGDIGGVNEALSPGSVHVSCSTIAPWTARSIAAAHADRGVHFVSAPVFARPDGMRAGQATIPLSGPKAAVMLVTPLLEATSSGVFTNFGEDPGAANVVKLAGNFLIASAIESLSEALAMAEANGVDREATFDILTQTIFNCLIYKGYGQRVASRDHAPYPDAHFALELGRKDVALIREVATRANVPMPIASLLVDRFASASAKERGGLDWSAIGLNVSEEAGVDTSMFDAWCRRENPRLGWVPPVK